jgi:hypothetical protein
MAGPRAWFTRDQSVTSQISLNHVFASDQKVRTLNVILYAVCTGTSRHTLDLCCSLGHSYLVIFSSDGYVRSRVPQAMDYHLESLSTL